MSQGCSISNMQLALALLLLAGIIKLILYEIQEYERHIKIDIPRLFGQEVTVMIEGTADFFEVNTAEENWDDKDIYNAQKWCIGQSSSPWKAYIDDETCATSIRQRVDELVSEKYQNITKTRFFLLIFSKQNGILNVILVISLLLFLVVCLRNLNLDHIFKLSATDTKYSSRNGMELVRLILISIVIFGHSYAISGNRSIEPFVNIFRATFVAPVANGIFLVISGFFTSKALSECSCSAEVFHFLLSRTKNLLTPTGVFALVCVFIVGPIYTELSLHEYFLCYETWDFLTKLSLPFDSLVQHDYIIDKTPPTLPMTFQSHRQILFNYDIGIAPQFWILKDLWFCYISYAVLCTLLHKLNINKHNFHRCLGVLAVWIVGTNALCFHNLFCFSNFTIGAGMYHNITLSFDIWVVIVSISVLLIPAFSPEPWNSSAFYLIIVPVLSYLFLSFGHLSTLAKRVGSKIPTGLSTQAFIWHFLIQRLVLDGMLSHKQFDSFIPRLAEFGMGVCHIVTQQQKINPTTGQWMTEVVTMGMCSHWGALILFLFSWPAVMLVGLIARAICNWIQKSKLHFFCPL